MRISNSAYEMLLREYDEKQLASRREQIRRVQTIEQQLPELSGINSRLAQISVEHAIARIKGMAEDHTAYEKEKAALVNRREELLASRGYSPYDLEAHYECPLCQDTGFAGNQPCKCFQSRMIELLYDQSNIREILQTENFSAYTFKYYGNDPVSSDPEETPLGIAKKAVFSAQEFIRNFTQSEDNLFINGETGTGKTFLCNCIAKEILDQGFQVIYLSAAKLFEILADGTFRSDSEQARISENLYTCDLLIIDDLGTEFANSFTQSAFFNCINERLLKKKHTVISTNLSIEQLRTNYSERIFSRIAEKYKFIKLLGEDIRIRKKLEG